MQAGPRIGIDFDNTIVCYDELFWSLARERNLIDDSILKTKDAVRDHLRKNGIEPEWTRLQGEAYGARILEAKPFAGVINAIQEFGENGYSVFIVSHKTKTPFIGETYDLHAAAMNWLRHHRVVSEESTYVQGASVYFELTKKEKLARIAELRCNWFIDDLPELLAEPDFPKSVGKILFDPHRQSKPITGVQSLHDWRDVSSLSL
jgi:hypothetical protein